MIKLSDYVMRTLADWGVRHVFLVTGGGAMHLNDSTGKEKRLRYVCTHHEQAAAMAAEAYARVTGDIGVVSVTTGPGSINALNGVFGAWTDSIPMLVISGQVKRETCLASYQLSGLRQLGDQEIDIVRLVSGITKYAALILDPASIGYHLGRARFLAVSGRPGPCWIDIPVDVQSSMVDEHSLRPYDPSEDTLTWDITGISQVCEQVLERIQQAKRPVILAGTGVRLAHAEAEFEAVVRMLGIPVTTAWTHDLIPSDDELFCGRPGAIGQRAGNFVVQNADLLLILGSRLNLRQVSYNWHSFAKKGFKIQVDVDKAELEKPTVRPDLPIHCDLRLFLSELIRQLSESEYSPGVHREWLGWCRERTKRYPPVLPRHRTTSGKVNPYHFVDLLFGMLSEDDVIVTGDGTACVVTFQAAQLKKGQRLFSNSGSASMGYDLPAAIGAAVARAGKRVICLAGDGSIQMNVQELQTVVHHQLPIKIFVLSNNGYLSIRTTQATFFRGNFVGESVASGVSFPDIVKVASAYGIPAFRIDSPKCLGRIPDLLSTPGPSLIDITLDPSQEFEPRLKSRQLEDGTIVTPELDDMYPFLDPDELKSNTIT